MRKKRGLSISRYGTSNPVNKYFIAWQKRKYSEQSPTILRKTFHEIRPKSFSQGFLLIFKFSENCPKIHREFSEK